MAEDQPLPNQCLFGACRSGLAAGLHLILARKPMRNELRDPYCGVLSTGHVGFRAFGLGPPCASWLPM